MPNALKLLRGSRKVNLYEPTFPPATTAAPAELDGDVLSIWNEACPALIASGVLTAVDMGRVVRSCKWESMGRQLLASAELVTGKERGELLRLAAMAHCMADKVWVALGLADPRERARLRPAAQEVDALEVFKGRHA
jgi:hypothetical protein